MKQTSKGLVSKETVVLRRWGRETQNFGFIVKAGYRSKRQLSISLRWPIYLINSIQMKAFEQYFSCGTVYYASNF